MEENINIAAILKDKPKGIRLYSPIFGECAFCYVREDTDDICVKKHNGEEEYFNSEGLYNTLGEVMLFPSREMRNWRKFAWKKGDVLVSNSGKVKVIFERFDDDNYTSFVGKHYLESYGKDGELLDYEEIHFGSTVNYTKESEESAQAYIKAVEERCGGKLNRETLEVEKGQPEFKDGDILLYKSAKFTFFSSIFILNIKRNEMSSYVRFSIGKGSIDYDVPVCCNLYTDRFRYATEEEKQQLFDALAKEGKAWDAEKKLIVDAEKKLIVDLKPKWTPKPFDRVITRNAADDVWTANIFSHMDSHGEYVTIACVGGYTYCLPYNEETAKLIGTTKDMEDYV